MPGDARPVLAVCVAPIAIHDKGDVLGQWAGLQHQAEPSPSALGQPAPAPVSKGLLTPAAG